MEIDISDDPFDFKRLEVSNAPCIVTLNKVSIRFYLIYTYMHKRSNYKVLLYNSIVSSIWSQSWFVSMLPNSVVNNVIWPKWILLVIVYETDLCAMHTLLKLILSYGVEQVPCYSAAQLLMSLSSHCSSSALLYTAE